jgi:hypothetical protein
MDVTRRAAARRPALIAKSYPTARSEEEVSSQRQEKRIDHHGDLGYARTLHPELHVEQIHAFHTTESRLAVAVEGAYLAAC